MPEVTIDDVTCFLSHGHTRRKLGHTLLQTFVTGGVATAVQWVGDDGSKERAEGEKKNARCDDLTERNGARKT